MGAHDQLTGLYNRRFSEREIKELDIAEQLPLSVIVGDLNALKLTNDLFGYQVGDSLLIRTAKIFKEVCRPGDLAARWGGDEFVLFLPRTDFETAGEICRQIKEKCRLQKNEPIRVNIALGRSTKKSPGENIWQILKEASDRMYSDKYLYMDSYKESIIASLKSALFKKSTETEEHAERLKIICREIGERMGLNSGQLESLELLAMLHDIGKVAIGKDILMKAGPLNDEEWAQMKKHPEIGYRFARSVPELAPISEHILSHHERWDGKGYPRG